LSPQQVLCVGNGLKSKYKKHLSDVLVTNCSLINNYTKPSLEGFLNLLDVMGNMLVFKLLNKNKKHKYASISKCINKTILYILCMLCDKR